MDDDDDALGPQRDASDSDNSRSADGRGTAKRGGWGKGQDKSRSRERPAPKPLDAAALERLALRYVERFATTRLRLTDYLNRKIRERGWADETAGAAADPAELAQRMAELGYVDDRAFAEQRAAAMQRRGLGARRVAGAFREAGIDESDADSVAPAIADRAVESALAFARRKRIGPYGSGEGDGHGYRKLHEKQLAAMLRAGHRFDLARRIVAAPPSAVVEASDFE
ncbi:RecX family transcriptional regulator [Sphingomonas sp. PP-F2F-G114-C0414]|uniref:regulatory protein RecX n=1 Tax=Sphingomonas sp. PP-F2F-G114-C0414 TaxID=2135662 RepID=UPI0016052CF8|nr:RecX family transcriptional regulator [Sphingomonas sp. PP-F2F-G114-C0414]